MPTFVDLVSNPDATVLEISKAFLQENKTINQLDVFGLGILHWAIKMDRPDLFEYCINRGYTDVAIKDQNNETLWDYLDRLDIKNQQKFLWRFSFSLPKNLEAYISYTKKSLAAFDILANHIFLEFDYEEDKTIALSFFETCAHLYLNTQKAEYYAVLNRILNNPKMKALFIAYASYHLNFELLKLLQENNPSDIVLKTIQQNFGLPPKDWLLQIFTLEPSLVTVANKLKLLEEVYIYYKVDKQTLTNDLSTAILKCLPSLIKNPDQYLLFLNQYYDLFKALGKLDIWSKHNIMYYSLDTSFFELYEFCMSIINTTTTYSQETKELAMFHIGTMIMLGTITLEDKAGILQNVAEKVKHAIQAYQFLIGSEQEDLLKLRQQCDTILTNESGLESRQIRPWEPQSAELFCKYYSSYPSHVKENQKLLITMIMNLQTQQIPSNKPAINTIKNWNPNFNFQQSPSPNTPEEDQNSNNAPSSSMLNC